MLPAIENKASLTFPEYNHPLMETYQAKESVPYFEDKVLESQYISYNLSHKIHR